MHVKRVYEIDNVSNTREVKDAHDAIQMDEQPATNHLGNTFADEVDLLLVHNLLHS